jgi:A/G-specific adenine glycosylase
MRQLPSKPRSRSFRHLMVGGPSTNPAVLEMDAASFSTVEVAALRSALLAWFTSNRRRMPWRGDAPPYTGGAPQQELKASAEASIEVAVRGEAALVAPKTSAYGTWVSEVMLQQTRVETVIRYWVAWMQTYPDVAALAGATEEQVFALWSGLGYYRRAANLLKGARFVVEKHAGVVPRGVKELLEVPGIGEYTAGAIASIAYGAAVPLVDGNVVRVLSRLRKLGVSAKSPALAKLCWRLAGQVVDPRRPGDFNQAAMECGATLCTPRSPACGGCPLRAQGLCQAFAEGEAILRARGVAALQLAYEEDEREDAGADAVEAGDAVGAAEVSSSKPAAVSGTDYSTGARSTGKARKVAAIAGSTVDALKSAKPKAQQASLRGWVSAAPAPAAKLSRGSAPAAGSAAAVASADIDIESAAGIGSARVSGAVGSTAAAAASSGVEDIEDLVTAVDDDEGTDGTAPGLSSSSAGGVAGSWAAGAAGPPERSLTPEEVAAISRFIEARYPAKPEKKAVPTLHLAAIVVVRDYPCPPAAPFDASPGLTAEADSVATADPAGTASASLPRCADPDFAGGGVRVWLHKGGVSSNATQAAVTPPLSHAAAGSSDDGEVLVLDESGCGASSAVSKPVAVAKPVAATGAAAKRSRATAGVAARSQPVGSIPGGLGGLLKDQWQPLVLPVSVLLDEELPGDNGATIGAHSSVGPTAAKRPRAAENGAAAGSGKRSAASVKGARGKAATSRRAAGSAAASAEDGGDGDEDEDGDAVPKAAAAPPTIDVASPRALAAIASSLAAAGLISGPRCSAAARTSHESYSSAAAEAALSPAFSSSSSSSSAAATAVSGGVDAAGWRVRHCGTLTHVFSHVIHRLQVLAVRLSTPPSPAGSLAAAPLDCATSVFVETPVASGVQVSADSATSTTAGSGGAAEGAGVGRWVRPAEFGVIGLTTWAAKLLYATLLRAETVAGSSNSCGEAAGAATPITLSKGASKAKGRAVNRPTAAPAKAAELSSAVAHMGVGAATLSPGDAAGLELLRKRWRTTHGKFD